MTNSLWMKLHWADWLADANLRRCSLAARGLWIDMLCIAAQSQPFGYLAAGDTPLDFNDISRICGVPAKEVEFLIRELRRNRVAERDDLGRLYAPRMLRDADKRMRAKKAGAQGGNPALCARNAIALPDNPMPAQIGADSHNQQSKA